MEPYSYQALPGEDFIRVLTLVSRKDGAADVHCALSSIALQGGVQYAALSYTWAMDEDGDDTLCRSIVVDGKAMLVTRNLYEGLRRLSDRDDLHTPIWIDAICINQADPVERQTMVASMALIFRRASRLIVWLGEGNDSGDNERFQSMLSCLDKRRHQHYREHMVSTGAGGTVSLCLAHAAWDAVGAQEKIRDRMQARQRTGEVSLEELNQAEPLPDCVRRLFDVKDIAAAVNEVGRLFHVLSRKRYWTRRWIIQEQYFAQQHANGTLIWGTASFPIISLKRFGRRFASFGRMSTMRRAFVSDIFEDDSDADVHHDHRMLTRIRNILELNTWINARKHLNYRTGASLFLWVMRLAEGWQCSDARDVVYCLLSIVPDTSLAPDHTRTSADVYLALCVEILKCDGHLATVLFMAVNRDHDDELASALPTWCPDFRCSIQKPTTPSTLLGPCSVDLANVLNCTLVLHGVYEDDGMLAWATGPEASCTHLPTLPPNILLMSTAGDRMRPGDWVCGFSRLENDDTKLILRNRGSGPADVFVVGSGRLFVAASDAEQHHLIDVRIH